MSEEQHFPESAESPEQRSQRAVAALEYEERAKLGFRRRIAGAMGDPYADPDRYLVDGDRTRRELWGGYLGAVAIIFGASALVYKPLLFGVIAAVCGIAGASAGGRAARIAKLGLIIACFGFFFGMLFAIWLEQPVY